jgi:hypothetical protein
MFNGKKPDRDLQGVEMLWNKVAGGLGFEPRLAESESVSCPLKIEHLQYSSLAVRYACADFCTARCKCSISRNA